MHILLQIVLMQGGRLFRECGLWVAKLLYFNYNDFVIHTIAYYSKHSHNNQHF